MVRKFGMTGLKPSHINAQHSDIVIAAMLGVEEYGVGMVVLVVMGCIMVWQCYSNICSVGVCTQADALW